MSIAKVRQSGRIHTIIPISFSTEFHNLFPIVDLTVDSAMAFGLQKTCSSLT